VAEPVPYRRVVEALRAHDAAVVEGQMMGMPALKAEGKMFGGLFEGELVAKLGRERVQELIANGRARQFDPSGRDRPMKDWARLPEPDDDWIALAQEARRSL
jgi:hypothetical protein